MPKIVYLVSPQGDIGVRRSPAFFSHEELRRFDVANHTGFDLTLFRIRVFAQRAGEEQVLAALNETRDRFLRFARACCCLSRPLYLLQRLIRFRPILRGQTRRDYPKWHLVWARLWWLEWRAGPVTTLEEVTP